MDRQIFKAKIIVSNKEFRNATIGAMNFGTYRCVLIGAYLEKQIAQLFRYLHLSVSCCYNLIPTPDCVQDLFCLSTDMLNNSYSLGAVADRPAGQLDIYIYIYIYICIFVYV